MPTIEKLGRWSHSKASEEYVQVRFSYPGHTPFEWSVPIVYPRLGLELTTDDAIDAHLATVYDQVHPDRHADWRAAQGDVWQGSRSNVTKPIFDAFVKDFAWLTYADLPAGSSNAARRLQALKELGYTVATRKRPGVAYEFMVLPIPRGAQTGYEWWSGSLRKRIVRLLGKYDAYEAKVVTADHLLPDHKFPEARWDAETRRETLEHLTDDEIRHDFQLINNQRNQQKREVCRTCLQTGRRGTPFGIRFYVEGGANWPPDVPPRGKAAERGCIGCGWYDLERWRQALIAKVSTR